MDPVVRTLMQVLFEKGQIGVIEEVGELGFFEVRNAIGYVEEYCVGCNEYIRPGEKYFVAIWHGVGRQPVCHSCSGIKYHNGRETIH